MQVSAGLVSSEAARESVLYFSPASGNFQAALGIA